jgi:hypothetical protein
MFKFFNKSKYKLTFLDEKWTVLFKDLKFFSVPKKGELLFFESIQKYYSVIEIINQYDNKQTILLIIKEFENSKK